MLNAAEAIHNNNEININTNSSSDHCILLHTLASLRINQETDIDTRQNNYLKAHSIIDNLNTEQW